MSQKLQKTKALLTDNRIPTNQWGTSPFKMQILPSTTNRF